jgi:hypothetical protein
MPVAQSNNNAIREGRMGRGAVIVVIQHYPGELVNSSRQAGAARTGKAVFLFDPQGFAKIIRSIALSFEKKYRRISGEGAFPYPGCIKIEVI